MVLIVGDYPEIPISLASTRTALKTGAWRSVRPVEVDRTAPCAAGCPAGVGIPVYMHLVRSGRLEEAFAAFTARNPFPRITGRVCPHLCEAACNLTPASGDAPVSIRSVERWLGDATADLPHARPHPTPVTGLRCGFGSGRAGGGVLPGPYRASSPSSSGATSLADAAPRHPRLPPPGCGGRSEIDRLRAMGIEFRTGVELGRDFLLDDCLESVPRSSSPMGASLSVRWASPVRPAGARPRVSGSVVRRGPKCPGPRRAVIGGGNTAMDVARVLRVSA
jgi:hypothetical protein